MSSDTDPPPEEQSGPPTSLQQQLAQSIGQYGPVTPPPGPNPIGGAAANEHTREEWMTMEEAATKEGKTDAAAYFRGMWQRLPTKEQKFNLDLARQMQEEYPTPLDILGAGVEPNLSMLTGAVATPLSGLMGGVKGLTNPAVRKLGSPLPKWWQFSNEPMSAAEDVQWWQDALTYQPRTEGGKVAAQAIASPFQYAHEHAGYGMPLGERLSQWGAGPGVAAGAEALTDLGVQLGSGELLGRATKPMSLRDPITKVPGLRWGAKKPPLEDVKTIADAGPVTTWGMRMAQSPWGWIRALGRGEETLQNQPWFGTIVRQARMRPEIEFDYAWLNDVARTPMGLEWIGPGHYPNFDEALLKTRNDLSEAFGNLLPQLHANIFDQLPPPELPPGARPPPTRGPQPPPPSGAVRDPTGRPVVLSDPMSAHEWDNELADTVGEIPGVRPETGPLTPEQKHWADLEGIEAKLAAEKYGWPGADEMTPQQRAEVRAQAEAQLPLFPDAPVSPHMGGAPPPAGGAPPRTPFPQQPARGRNFIGEMIDLIREARNGKKGGNGLIQLTDDSDKKTFQILFKSIIDKATHSHQDAQGNWVKGGEIDGADLQQIDRWIRAARRRAERADTAGSNSGQLVPYLEQVEDLFREMINASNPGSAAALKQHQIAWSGLKLVEEAYTSRGGLQRDPPITPARALETVRARALRKPEGRALLASKTAQGQKLAAAAQNIMGKKVGRGISPTAEISDVLTAVGEATSDLATVAADPTGTAGKVGLGLLAYTLGEKGLYGRPLQKWFQDKYLRGYGTLPGTNFPLGSVGARALPAAMSTQQRDRAIYEQQLADELAQLSHLGVAPPIKPPEAPAPVPDDQSVER